MTDQLNWYGDTDHPVDESSVQTVDRLSDNYFSQRLVVDEMKTALKVEQEKLDEMEAKFLLTLNEIGKDFWVTENGRISKVKRFTVPTPKTMEEKTAFFNYLRERGVFEEMVNINHNTLNSFYKEELESAASRGETLQIPGLQEPTYSESLMMRRNKHE